MPLLENDFCILACPSPAILSDPRPADGRISYASTKGYDVRIMRRIGALVALLVALTMALSACGSGTPGVSKEEDRQDAGAAGGPVIVNFWCQQFEDYQTAWVKKWIAEFNKAQDEVEVKLTVVPGDAWAQKMKAAQAAGKAPDVYTINYGSIAPAVADGQLVD